MNDSMVSLKKTLEVIEEREKKARQEAMKAQEEAAQIRNKIASQRDNAMLNLGSDMHQFLKDEDIYIRIATNPSEFPSTDLIELYGNDVSMEMSHVYERKGYVSECNVEDVNEAYNEFQAVKVTFYIPRERVAHLIDKNFG